MLHRLRTSLARPMDFPVFAQFLVIIAFIGLTFANQQAQNDTWWHLRAGKDIWQQHAVPTTDTWTWTVRGDAWPDHEWLWQAIAYALHSVGGLPLFAAVNGLLFVGALVLALGHARPTRFDVLVLIATAPMLAGLWSLRPQVASLFLFALLLKLLRDEKWIWIPPLMLLWANVHGGVVYGGVALVAVSLAAVLLWIPDRSVVNRKRAGRVVLTTVVAGLVTLVTPLGIELWAYVTSFNSRYGQDDIAEWQSVWHTGPLAVCFWLVTLAMIVVVIAQRRRLGAWPIVVQLSISLALLPVAMSAIRNVPFFVLVSAALIGHLLRRPRGRTEESDAPATVDDAVPRARWVLVGAALIAAAVVAAAWVNPPSKLAWTPVSSSAVASVRSCPPHIYNTYDSGGFLVWFAPTVPVFVDSRQDPFGEPILKWAELRDGDDYRDDFEDWDIRCAFVETGSTSASTLTTAGWTTQYEDDDWTVLRRP